MKSPVLMEATMWRLREIRRKAARDADKLRICSLEEEVERLRNELAQWIWWSWRHTRSDVDEHGMAGGAHEAQKTEPEQRASPIDYSRWDHIGEEEDEDEENEETFEDNQAATPSELGSEQTDEVDLLGYNEEYDAICDDEYGGIEHDEFIDDDENEEAELSGVVDENCRHEEELETDENLLSDKPGVADEDCLPVKLEVDDESCTPGPPKVGDDRPTAVAEEASLTEDGGDKSASALAGPAENLGECRGGGANRQCK